MLVCVAELLEAKDILVLCDKYPTFTNTFRVVLARAVAGQRDYSSSIYTDSFRLDRLWRDAVNDAIDLAYAR